ncbi:MAG: DUF6259 domain-containing protein [Armatimonadota bacterium]|jgi:hypothetical protein
MTRHPLALLPVLGALCCALALPAFAEVYEAPGIAIEVSEEAPLGIIAIRASADGPALYTSPDSVETTWELLMVDAAGDRFTVDPLSHTLPGRVTLADGTMTLAWDPAQIPGGTVTVTCTFEPAAPADCRRGAPMVYARIEVANESDSQLRAVQFPRLTFVPGPSAADEATLVFPRAYGRSWRNPFDAPRGYLVGTIEPAGLHGDAEMQFGTLYDDAGNGLYWAHYDGAGYHKRTVYDNTNPGEIEFKMEHLPEDCLTPGQDYASTYPVALAAYQGDWWDAARMYREWALQQKWAQQGPIKHREDVADWVRDADVWVRGDARRYTPELAESYTNELQDALGVSTVGVQFYGWYHDENGEPNWMAPLGWPMVEGYPEMIARARERGVHHTPYVNSLQVDFESMDIPESARAAILLDENLEGRRWSDEGEAYIMCAATETWKDILVRASEQLVRDGNVSGIYLDQLGGHCGRPCYSPDHGHPVGGGTYATDGLREICQAILDGTRAHFPDAALSGEVQHETLIDVSDHRLCHYNYWPGWVNLWPAVYGDYMVNYGRTISLAQSPLADGMQPPAINFFGPCGNTLVAGMAFGRIWPTGNEANLINSPGNEDKRAYLQACVDLRQAARDWLEFGYLQRPVQMLTEIPDVPIDDPKGRPSSIKAVLDSAWINEDGALAFVFTNVSEEPQQFQWQADLTRYEIAPAEVYRIRRIMPDAERRSVAEIEMPRITRTETLDAHEIAIYEVTVGAY